MIKEDCVNFAIANKINDRNIVDEYYLGDGEWHYEYEMYDNNEKK